MNDKAVSFIHYPITHTDIPDHFHAVIVIAVYSFYQMIYFSLCHNIKAGNWRENKNNTTHDTDLIVFVSFVFKSIQCQRYPVNRLQMEFGMVELWVERALYAVRYRILRVWPDVECIIVVSVWLSVEIHVPTWTKTFKFTESLIIDFRRNNYQWTMATHR